MTKEIQVLFLDDEESILDGIQRLFIKEPYGIFTTSSADRARDILSKEKIKVMVSDQRMPEIHGVKFLQEVKKKNPDVIRILFTGYTDFSAAEEAINVGEVYRFISKPWKTAELLSTIRQSIEHYNLVVENRKLFEETKTKKEELELANKKLKAMYEMQKEFTSTVSHELRTPLASIKTAIDIVMSGTAGDLTKDQKNFLGKAKDNVDRLSRLINDILNLSKLESGKMQLKMEKCNINNLIKEIVSLQEPVAKHKGLQLKTELDSQLSMILMDSDRIVQLVSNLMNNAIKFTETGGIIVSSRNHRDSNHIQVSVKDTGPGIKEEDMPKLFQKFQQLGDPATRQTGGTGLGLAICREIINQHGGKIWVESKLGKGTEFHFILPIEERRKEK